MKKYLAAIKEWAGKFLTFKTNQIMRTRNTHANALAIQSLMVPDRLKRVVLVSAISISSVGTIDPKAQIDIAQVEEESCIHPFINYLENGVSPTERRESHKLEIKSKDYTILQDQLYRRNANGPWLKCLMENEVKVIVNEVHEGECKQELMSEDNQTGILLVDSVE